MAVHWEWKGINHYMWRLKPPSQFMRENFLAECVRVLKNILDAIMYEISASSPFLRWKWSYLWTMSSKHPLWLTFWDLADCSSPHRLVDKRLKGPSGPIRAQRATIIHGFSAYVSAYSRSWKIPSIRAIHPDVPWSCQNLPICPLHRSPGTLSSLGRC